jgi:hypothetical protein
MKQKKHDLPDGPAQEGELRAPKRFGAAKGGVKELPLQPDANRSSCSRRRICFPNLGRKYVSPDTPRTARASSPVFLGPSGTTTPLAKL